MKQEVPKRIALIGLPGSGKSTFAINCGKILGIPVHHLDKKQFDGNKKRDRQQFLSIQEELVSGDSWFIEGCSITTLEMRFAQADTVIYFHFPRLLCLWRVYKRLFFHGQIISDSGCAKVPNWGLLKYIWNFDKEKRGIIEDLRRKYPQVNFVTIRSSKEALKYMEELK